MGSFSRDVSTTFLLLSVLSVLVMMGVARDGDVWSALLLSLVSLLLGSSNVFSMLLLLLWLASGSGTSVFGGRLPVGMKLKIQRNLSRYLTGVKKKINLKKHTSVSGTRLRKEKVIAFLTHT